VNLDNSIKSKNEVNKNNKTEKRFNKQQMLISEQFANQRDLLEALLENNKSYTLSEVDNMIKKYMKGQVN
jgi:arginine repressor